MFQNIRYYMGLSGSATATSDVVESTMYHVTTVTDDDNGRTYQEHIPFERDRGLIKIDNRDYRTSCRHEVDLVLERHPANHVEIIAFIPFPTVLKLDPSHPNTEHRDNLYYKGSSMQWKPFDTDVIKDLQAKHRTKEPRFDTLRGGNRLTISLIEATKYLIRIPSDADLEVCITLGDITYATHPPCSYSKDAKYKVATSLRTRCKKVNFVGQSGSGGNWDYFWGQPADPITLLETKDGSITLPNLNL